jgi:broad specificity phosphatase PhoE
VVTEKQGEQRATTTTRPVVSTVFVVRHAESEANAGHYFASQSDSKISPRGREQVERLARAVTKTTIHAVYSSDLSRAYETVEPIARMRGLAVRTDPGLRERHMGRLTGMTFDEVKAEMPEVWHRLVARDPHLRPPDGESQFDLGERVKQTMARIVPKHRGESIVIGSHGVTINHIVRQLLGVHDLEIGFWVAVNNASVTRIDLTETAHGRIAPRLVFANLVLDENEDLLG